MGLNSVYQATVQVTGQGFGMGGVPALEDTPASTPASTNAPPPDHFTVQAGTNQLLMPPNTFTFSRVTLMPLGTGASSNAKTIKGATGDTGLSGWTAGSITVPAVPGGSVYVTSASTETLLAAYS